MAGKTTTVSNQGSTLYTAKEIFDGLLAYYQAYQTECSGRLMHWLIDKRGYLLKEGAAIDGDEDVAMALLLAHKQWGDSCYKSVALKILDGIRQCGIEHNGDTHTLIPGSDWGGCTGNEDHDFINPSYFAPAWYRHFKVADQTNASMWESLVSRSYHIIGDIQSNIALSGFVPNWSTCEGTRISDPPPEKNPYNADYNYHYWYDATRMPWRLGVDYLWNGTGQAYSVLDNMTESLKEETGRNTNNIRSGYYIVDDQNHKAGDAIKPNEPVDEAFLGTFGVASMVSPDHQKWCNSIYNKLRGSEPSEYFQSSLKVLTLLTMTGNMSNLLEQKAPGQCVADFSANPMKGPVPLTVSFTDQSTGSITSWEWDFGDWSKSTEQNPSHTYTAPGTYTVSLAVTGPDGSDTEIKGYFITVLEKQKAMPWIPLLLLDD